MRRMSELLAGRRGLVVGVANERSLAYGIARAARQHGAEVVLTHQNERLREPVSKIATELGAAAVLPCDVAEDAQIAALMTDLQGRWGRLDFVVHAVAAARREELDGRFVDTSRAGFAMALDVSVYSLLALARAAEPLLRQGTHPSILTLSYYAAEKAMPHYNVMGVAKAALESAVRYLALDLGPQRIRVNALSPGPVRTLSAAGVKGLRKMLAHVEQHAPLHRNVTLEDVGDAALGLLSHLGRSVTGEIVHVDGGYHVLGAPGVDGP